MNKLTRKNNKGFGLMEVVVGIAIIAAVLTGLFTAFTKYFHSGVSNTPRVKATIISEEGVEAIRYMRDKGWSANIDSLSTDTKYYLEYATSSGWSASANNPGYVMDKFDRSFVLKDVYRDSSTDDIDPSGSDLDPNTLKFIVSVSWKNGNSTSTVKTKSYITNVFNE